MGPATVLLTTALAEEWRSTRLHIHLRACSPAHPLRRCQHQGGHKPALSMGTLLLLRHHMRRRFHEGACMQMQSQGRAVTGVKNTKEMS